MLARWYLPALFAGILIPAAARADDPMPKTAQEKLDASIKQLDQKLTQVQNDIAGLDGRIRRLESNSASANELIETNKSIADLRKAIDSLRSDLVRTSAKPTPGHESMPPYQANRLATGSLHVTNEFAFPQDVLVNGINYTVEPGQAIQVALPAGPFSFQVLSKDALPRTRELAGGTVYTVRIR